MHESVKKHGFSLLLNVCMYCIFEEYVGIISILNLKTYLIKISIFVYMLVFVKYITTEE